MHFFMMENTNYIMQKQKIKLSCKGTFLENENGDISILLFN